LQRFEGGEAAKSRRLVRAFARVSALVFAFTLVAPASAFASPASYGGIAGTVTDDTTHLPMANVIVTVFDYRGSYVQTVWTDALGHYQFTVGTSDGPYRLVLIDHNPARIYAEQSYSNNGILLDGTPVAVSSGTTQTCDVQMHRALNIVVVARRQGCPETMLSGMGVGLLYDHGGLREMNMDMTAGGLADFRGLPIVPAATWQLTLFDPNLVFGPPVSTDATSYPTSGTYVVSMELPLADMSKDVVVSTPKAKARVKRNAGLAFTGTLSRRVTTPKTLTVRAYRLAGATWVLGKSVSAKIKAKKTYSTYAGSIKLPKLGTWKLVAVFAGNASYVTTNSGYAFVTVKK
jgi:hypothetical protein